MKTNQEKLAYILNRMAAPGYYLVTIYSRRGNLNVLENKPHGVIYISPDAQAQVASDAFENSWETCHWNSAPTKSYLEEQDLALEKILENEGGCLTYYEYYPTYTSLLACGKPLSKKVLEKKSTLDKE